MAGEGPTRRGLLRALGAASTGVAGCLSDGSTTGRESGPGGTTRRPATGDGSSESTTGHRESGDSSPPTVGTGATPGSGRVTPDSPVVAWQFRLGREIATRPAFQDGTVYTGTAGAPPTTPGSGGSNSGRDLYAIDTGGTVRWRYPTTHNVASRPVVVDGTVVFVTGASGMMVTDGWGVTGLTAEGRRRWRVETEPAEMLTAGDSTVFVGEHEGDYGTDAFPATAVRAVDPATGRDRWRGRFGKFERVAVRDGTLFVGTSREGRSDDGLHAVDTRTGRERWSQRDVLLRAVTDEALYGYRTVEGDERLVGLGFDGDERWAVEAGVAEVFAVGDGRVYAPRDGALVATDAADGTVRWRFEPEFELDWAAGAQFVAGTLFLASGDGTLVALSPGGTERWRVTEPSGRIGAVTVAGGSALVEPTRMDGLVALDPTDGTERWRLHTRGEPHGPVVGDRAYLASGGGDVYALDVSGY